MQLLIYVWAPPPPKIEPPPPPQEKFGEKALWPKIAAGLNYRNFTVYIIYRVVG